MRQRQSREDREKRLADLRCPVHGTGLSQIDEDHMQCPRRDCRICFQFGQRDIVARLTDMVLVVPIAEAVWQG